MIAGYGLNDDCVCWGCFINQYVASCQGDNTGAGNSKQIVGIATQAVGDGCTAVGIGGKGGDADRGADLSILSNAASGCAVGVLDRADSKFIDIDNLDDE